MKKNYSKFLTALTAFLFLSVASLSLGSLIPNIFSTDTSSDPQSAGLALMASKSRFNLVGDTITLTATVSPSNASDKRVNWTTSDPDSVEISNTSNTSTGGEATLTCEAVFDGTVTITATTVDGGFQDTCLVTYYESVESYAVVSSSRNYNTIGEPFLYYNGSDYYAHDYDGHSEDEFHFDLYVAPLTATLATSFSRLFASDWISSTSNFVSAPSQSSYYGAANSYAAGEIIYDVENGEAVIPLRFAADFSSIQGGTIEFDLDGVIETFDVELYIAVSGVSVNPPSVII